MALELYMVGVMVKDMPRAVEFYRRLGMAVPEGSETKTFVEIKMSYGLTFFLNGRSDPLRSEPAGGYRILLEFYLQTQAAVDAKYQEMIDFGYTSYAAPFKNQNRIYFALINDPDGNTILLSGEPAETETAEAGETV